MTNLLDLGIVVNLPPDLTAALDLWIASQPEPRPKRDAAIEYALRDWLTGLGLLVHHDEPDVLN